MSEAGGREGRREGAGLFQPGQGDVLWPRLFQDHRPIESCG